jgi:hypothetical protein
VVTLRSHCGYTILTPAVTTVVTTAVTIWLHDCCHAQICYAFATQLLHCCPVTLCDKRRRGKMTKGHAHAHAHAQSHTHTHTHTHTR